MNPIKLNSLARIFLNNIKKYAQTVNTAPKYNRAVKANIADIGLAISDLTSSLTLLKPNDSMARTCVTKLIQYLSWFKTVGAGGDANAQGKDQIIPTVEEMKSLIKTGIFGPIFIMSLASILKLNDAIPQLKTEFDNLNK